MCAHPVRFCLVSALLSTAAAACGQTPTSPAPGVGFPTLTCPVSIRVPAAGLTTRVSYAGPFATGGTPPEPVNCSAASNSVFPVGTTPVTCATTDANGRLAACTFSVTVLPPPLLQGTTFLVFGDSVAEGENGVNGPPDVPFPCSPAPPRMGLAFIDCRNAYSTLLGSLLTARYVVQTPVVLTRGLKGELAVGQNQGAPDPGGSDRIGPVLDQTRPDALLLLEGINDVSGQNESFSDIINALAFDIDQAKARNVKKIFLSTLTPVKIGDLIFGTFIGSGALPRFNDLIRALASQKGVVLVDGYAALAGNTDPSIGGDGIHLTPLGNQELAQAWFAAIEANFEQPSTPTVLRHR